MFIEQLNDSDPHYEEPFDYEDPQFDEDHELKEIGTIIVATDLPF